MSSLRRPAWEPGPVTAPISPNAASTSVRDRAAWSCGAAALSAAASSAARAVTSAVAGARSISPTAAYPTPIWPCSSSPDRKATATVTSPGGTRPSNAAICSILALRAEVAVTAPDTSTTSLSSTQRFCPTQGRGSETRPGRGRAGYSQPFSFAIRAASARLRAPSFWIAADR